jgi:hypothetical protein
MTEEARNQWASGRRESGQLAVRTQWVFSHYKYVVLITSSSAGGSPLIQRRGLIRAMNRIHYFRPLGCALCISDSVSYKESQPSKSVEYLCRSKCGFPSRSRGSKPSAACSSLHSCLCALLLTKTKFAIRQEFQNGSRLFEAIHSRHDNSSHYTIGTKVLRGRYCLVSIIGNPDVVAATWVMKSLSKKVWRIPMLTHRSKYLRILPQRNWKITSDT